MSELDSPTQDAIKKNIHNYLDILKTSPDEKERSKVLYLLGYLEKEYLKDTPEILDILHYSIIHDTDIKIRAKIAQMLSYMDISSSSKALLTSLHKDPSMIVRWRAARALGTYSLPEIVPDIILALKKENHVRVRNEIIYSLGQIGDNNAIPILVDCINNDDENSYVATNALYYIHSDLALSTLIDLLNSVKNENLIYVVSALELFGSKAEIAVKSLYSLIKKQDISYNTRTKAIIAIGNIGGKLAISFIKKELDTETSSDIRCWLALAYARLLGSNSEGADLLDEYFSTRYMSHEQISEYRDLKRKWFYDKKPNKKSGKAMKIKELIMNGESNSIEFKEHLRWNKHTENINKETEFKICKTLSAFMNTDGGSLFIGINDKGVITGLHDDYSTFKNVKQNRDGFNLHLNELIKTYIGIDNFVYLSIHIENMENQDICLIEIIASPEPIYIKGKDGKSNFAIRVESSSVFLDAKQTQDYIRKHFK